MEEQAKFFTDDEIEKMVAVDFEDWVEANRELRRAIRGGVKKADQWKWRLGDYLLIGQKRWGERKIRYQAPRIWKMKWGTLKNYRWVSSVFPARSSRRRDGVSWEHHRIVAALPEQEQDKFLTDCKFETVRQLRARIKAAKTAPQKMGEELANTEAIMKGEFPLRIEPIKIIFPSHGVNSQETKLAEHKNQFFFSEQMTAALLYLYETEQATHGKKSRMEFLLWLIENQLERLGWVPKGKEFVANWQARRKAMRADVAKRVAEQEARKCGSFEENPCTK